MSIVRQGNGMIDKKVEIYSEGCNFQSIIFTVTLSRVLENGEALDVRISDTDILISSFKRVA